MGYRLGIADTLRATGLKVVEVDGWQKRGGDVFDPVGVVVHHTASAPGKDAPSLNICINGRSDLPGPLCHVLLARSGICHVIAAGRANHAGEGGWAGHSGNRYWFGIEAENDGVGEPWPDVQLDAFITATRALAALSSKGLVCGHKEYAPTRKIDPTGIDMDWFRAQVATEQEDDDMFTADHERALGSILALAKDNETRGEEIKGMIADLGRAVTAAATGDGATAQEIVDELAKRLEG